ncbi:MAG: DUF697 domain-containing protein [Spirulinaceae cyanobacterium SM2_1_0]|nr:DUF697 domain-containing protein [Spirulinaceae cyanobacterium SM2_1_0]
MSWQQKPILVGGLSLSGGLWLWWQLQATAAESGELLVWLVIALGSGLWWLRQRSRPRPIPAHIATPVARAEVEQAIALAREGLQVLAVEAPDSDRQSLEQRLTALPAQLDRQADRIVLLGGRKVGKTRLLQTLQTADWAAGWQWQEIPDSLQPEQQTASVRQALTADLILFVVAGDLTDSELHVLQVLRDARAPLLVIFNKLDQYAPSEQVDVLQQLRQRLASWLPAADVVAAAADPAPLKVRQQQPDGSVREQFEARSPDLTALSERLAIRLTTERPALAWATAWRATEQLAADITAALQQVRRDRALPIVERYQWLAAATAFANPVPVLDLLATAAIGAQLVIDLGAVYQHKFALAQAKTLASTLGALVAKLGLVELSTQAIASVLKTNVVSYAAGGAVQGLSAAYLTRLTGLSLMEYFQTADPSAELNPTQLEQALQTVFQTQQRATVWQSFVRAGLARLQGTPAATESPAT